MKFSCHGTFNIFPFFFSFWRKILQWSTAGPSLWHGEPPAPKPLLVAIQPQETGVQRFLQGWCLQSPFTFYTCVWLLIWRTLGGQQRNVWRKALSLPIASVSDPLVLIVKRLRMFFRMNASRRYLPCVEWMARHTTAHALHTPQELLWIIKACARP